jgi:hypothetical protein
MSFKLLDKKYKDFKKVYKKIGFGKLLKRIIFQKGEEFLLKKDLNEESNFVHTNKLEIELFEEKSLQELIKFCKKDGNNPENMFVKYLENDCKAFIAKQDGNIIGYIWWGNQNMTFYFNDPDFRYVGKIVSLKNDGVYAFDYYITPKYRGNSNAIEFLSKVFVNLRESGFNWVFGCVHVSNIPARWIYKLMGFKEEIKIVARRFFLFFIFKNRDLFFDRNGHKSLFTVDEYNQKD